MIHYAMYVILKLFCHIALSARNGRLPSRQRLSKDIVASLVTSKACYCIFSVYMYVVHIFSISYSSIFTVYTVYAYSVIILSHRSVSKEWQIAIKATFL